MSIRGIALAGMASFLAGCTSWGWSGHPAGATSASPPRAGTGGHETRGHGVSLHGAPADRPYSIAAAAKDAAPFLAKAPRTPVEYLEAGRAYLDKADQHRREAASHYAMKQLYVGKDPAMAAHCDRLIEQLSALAAQYEDMSILHEEKARELKKGME